MSVTDNVLTCVEVYPFSDSCLLLFDPFLDPSSSCSLHVPIKLAMKNSMFNPSQFLVRTDLCKKVGGCDERIKFSQEYSLTLRLSVFGKFIRFLKDLQK